MHHFRGGEQAADLADLLVVELADRNRPPLRRIPVNQGSISSKPVTCCSIYSLFCQPSSRMMAIMARVSRASVPGRTARWMSAISAVSDFRGSMTTSSLSGFFENSLSTSGARGIWWLCMPFQPMARSMSEACSSGMPKRYCLPVNPAGGPEDARELLGKGAVVVAGAQRAHEPHPEGGLEVAALAASAHVGIGFRTMLSDDFLDPERRSH